MFGQLGSTIKEALATEFFQWFHLKKTSETVDGDLTRHLFQPTAPPFHELVKVTLTANAAQSLQAAELAIQRSFIDDPNSFTLAADIAKSFLFAVLNREDAAALDEASMQIRHYEPAGSQVMKMHVAASGGDTTRDALLELESMKNAIDSGKPVYLTMKPFKMEGGKAVSIDVPEQEPPLPGEGQPAFLTYSGLRAQLDQKLHHALLHMENNNPGGVEQLTISVSPL